MVLVSFFFFLGGGAGSFLLYIKPLGNSGIGGYPPKMNECLLKKGTISKRKGLSSNHHFSRVYVSMIPKMIHLGTCQFVSNMTIFWVPPGGLTVRPFSKGPSQMGGCTLFNHHFSGVFAAKGKRLTAGTYTNHPFRKEYDLPSTSLIWVIHPP